MSLDEPQRSGTAAAWFHRLLDAVGSQPDAHGRRQCPAHDDSHPSLSLTERSDGAARLRCFAGCNIEDILRALGCGMRQLYEPPRIPPEQFARQARLRLRFPPVQLRHGHPAGRGFRLEAVHHYDPAPGTRQRIAGHQLLRWRHPTSGTKELEWETRLAGGNTRPGLLGTPEHLLPLYQQRKVQLAVAVNEPVLIVESESSCDALAGWCATTWAGGARAVNTAALRRQLHGFRHQILVPDRDPAGMACAHTMLTAGLGPAVLVGQPGEDARDLHRRLGPASFQDLVEHVQRLSHRDPVIVAVEGRLVHHLSIAALPTLATSPAPSRSAGPPAAASPDPPDHAPHQTASHPAPPSTRPAPVISRPPAPAPASSAGRTP